MKIAVCDDSARDMAQVKNAFENIKDRFELDIQYYGSGEELISAAEKDKDISLVILDIYI